MQGSHTLGKTKKTCKQPSQRHSAGNIECESLSRGNSQDGEVPEQITSHVTVQMPQDPFRNRSKTFGDTAGKSK